MIAAAHVVYRFVLSQKKKSEGGGLIPLAAYAPRPFAYAGGGYYGGSNTPPPLDPKTFFFKACLLACQRGR